MRCTFDILMTTMALASLASFGASTALAQQQPVPRKPVGPGEERVHRIDYPVKRVRTAADLRHLPDTTRRVLGVGLDDDAMMELDSLTGLRELELQDCAPTRDGWRQLARLSQLERLTIRDCQNIDAFVIGFIDELETLRVLRLQDLDELTGAMLQPLADNSAIRVLDLSGCRKAGNDAITRIVRMESVWSLTLSRTGVRDSGVQKLREMKNSLKELLLENVAGITDAALQVVDDLPRLDGLSVAQCRQLTDEGMALIADNGNLRVLSVAGCRRTTDAGMTELAGLPNLQYLDVSECTSITDHGIRTLGRELARTLMYLDFSGCPRLTDSVFNGLRGCDRLEWLHAERLSISGRGLATVSQLPVLRELVLRGCRSLTDDGVGTIESDSLEVVDVRDCPNVTARGIADVKRSVPNLETLKR